MPVLTGCLAEAKPLYFKKYSNGKDNMIIRISDCEHKAMREEEQAFAAAGLSFTLLQCRTEEDTIRDCKGADILMNQYAPLTRNVLTALAPELKLVVRYGVGVNNVDMDAASELGVQVCNVPDYGMHEVSDHGVALMLALSRKLVPMNTRTQRGEWNYLPAIPARRLAEQTVGTVGLGRNGRLFAAKARAFGCAVIAFDAYYTPNKEDGTEHIRMVSLPELLRESDYIAVNCPLTAETRNLFDDEAFETMKNSAFIINTARGGVIHEEALARALKEGKIAGAGLDVFAVEPLPGDSPLRGLENCILTPHMAWYSEESSSELKRKVAEEAIRYAKGEPVHYPVNTI